MTEIKFRAWVRQAKEMIPVDSIYFDGFGGFELSGCGYHDMDHLEVDIMQYTGLKDKNGKEIYEGDIVEYKDYSNGAIISFSGEDKQPRRRGVIELLNLFLGILLTGCGFLKTEQDTEKKLEVIGNIHENPELLKSEAT